MPDAIEMLGQTWLEPESAYVPTVRMRRGMARYTGHLVPVLAGVGGTDHISATARIGNVVLNGFVTVAEMDGLREWLFVADTTDACAA